MIFDDTYGNGSLTLHISSENVSIPNTHRRARGRGGQTGRTAFAFVDLDSAVEAQRALESLHENVLQERKISVKLAKPITPRAPKVSVILTLCFVLCPI